MKTTLLAIATLSLLAIPVVHADPDVTVLLKVSAGTYLAPGALCPVSVPAGSDGVALLDAAVEQGCLTSWNGTHFAFGTFVSCVDGICEHNAGEVDPTLQDLDGTYWETSYGLHTAGCSIECYRATDLDVFGLTYQDWFASVADFVVSSTLP